MILCSSSSEARKQIDIVDTGSRVLGNWALADTAALKLTGKEIPINIFRGEARQHSRGGGTREVVVGIGWVSRGPAQGVVRTAGSPPPTPPLPPPSVPKDVLAYPPIPLAPQHPPPSDDTPAGRDSEFKFLSPRGRFS